MTIPLVPLEVFLLSMVRITAFLVIAPPLAHRAVPMRVKAMLGAGLGLAVMPRALAAREEAGLTTGAIDSGGAEIIGDVLYQALIGFALGFLISMIFAAVQAAGNLIDLFGGFQIATAFDPMSQTSGAQFSRLYAMTATVLLFASGAYQLLLGGLARTFDVLPLGASLELGQLAQAAVTGLTDLFLTSLQIAGPLLIVLFLADAGLGLLTRVAPALNAFALGFPLKILLTLSLGAFAFLALPEIIHHLTDQSVSTVLEVAG